MLLSVAWAVFYDHQYPWQMLAKIDKLINLDMAIIRRMTARWMPCPEVLQYHHADDHRGGDNDDLHLAMGIE